MTRSLFLTRRIRQGLLIATVGMFMNEVAQAAPARYILHVQLSPAVCLLEPSHQQYRKCLEGFPVTIAGLIPELDRRISCYTTSSANLSPVQGRVVARVMPDEDLRVRLWYAVGGCVPMNASTYFRTIVQYAETLRVPSEVRTVGTVRISRSAFVSRLLQLNPSLGERSVRLMCSAQPLTRRVYLTEIKVCYSNRRRYMACSESLVSSCPSTFLIQGPS